MLDDVIGFMNWIVLKFGYKIKSYVIRGIEYVISFKFLKYLYVYIIDMYRFLDFYFIYGFLVDVLEELFVLKLKLGECYLD